MLPTNSEPPHLPKTSADNGNATKPTNKTWASSDSLSFPSPPRPLVPHLGVTRVEQVPVVVVHDREQELFPAAGPAVYQNPRDFVVVILENLGVKAHPHFREVNRAPAEERQKVAVGKR